MRSKRKRRSETPLQSTDTAKETAHHKRPEKRLRHVESEKNDTDDEDTGMEGESDHLADEDTSPKRCSDCLAFHHKGIIPPVGTKLRADILTCNRCWEKSLLCVRQPGGQVCKACRLIRVKCSRVIPTCPRRRNITDEDELRWRVLGVDPPPSSSVQGQSGNGTQKQRCSSERSTRLPHRNISRKQSIKTTDNPNEDESEEDHDSQGWS